MLHCYLIISFLVFLMESLKMKTEMVAAMDPFVLIHSAQIRSAAELKMRHLVITRKQLDFLPPDNAC